MSKDPGVYAQKQLDQIYKNPDYKDVLDKLCGHEPNFALIEENIFGIEYLAARLAVACRGWENACDENSIEEESFRKAFLRAVMESFKSEKFLNIATAFSEYYFTLNAESGPVIPIVEQFFRRLKVDPSPKEGSGQAPPRNPGGQGISEAFQMLFYLSESFRTDFENQLFDFIFTRK